MKNKLLIFISLLGMMLCNSCQDYLDETPDKSGSAYIYHMDQLYGLMGSTDLYLLLSPPQIIDMSEWGMGILEIAIPAGFYGEDAYLLSDAVEYSPQYYTDASQGQAAKPYDIYSFGTEELINRGEVALLTWQPCWERIFRFNTVMEYLEKVQQTTEAARNQVEGEARFGRAYFHFILLTQYCLWQEDAPGIGYRESTSPQDKPGRETVKYTLAHIYEDLRLAEEALTRAGRTDFDFTRNFRPTVATVQAFRARVDLYRGNYASALTNAEAALAKHSTLVSFKDDPRYTLSDGEKVYLLDASGQVEDSIVKKTMQLLQGEGMAAVAKYEEMYLPHVTNSSHKDYGMNPMSESFYNIWLDKENDARWLYFYSNYKLLSPYNMPGVLTSIDGKQCMNWETRQWIKPANYCIYSRFSANGAELIGMTTAEMFLIKAECLARKGETGEAMEVLKKLRRTRFMTDAAAENIETTVDADGKVFGKAPNEVKVVLAERYREMGAIWRYFDMKRLNGAEHAGITITRELLIDPTNPASGTRTLTIKPDDPRWAMPFDGQELEGMGWTQNSGWE